MKILVLLAYLLSSLFPVWQDKQPPEPIEGTASITSEEFKTPVGPYEFVFNFPDHWGMGDYSVTPDGKAHFVLLPTEGGLGCTIDVEPCLDKKSLKNQMLSLEKTFRSVTPLKEGFEAKMDGAWFLCKNEGQFLLQIWYVTPYIGKNDLLLWEGLKQCLTIQDPQKVASSKVNHLRVTEEPSIGWWCHQPSSQYDVLFETVPVTNAKPNQGGAKNYFLKFKEVKSSGYFYVKWQVASLDKVKSYKDHLRLMESEIKKIDPTQKSDFQPEIDLNNRYAKLSGYPYQFITLAGDGFLFGFAVKANNPYVKPDLDDLIKRVKWKLKSE